MNRAHLLGSAVALAAIAGVSAVGTLPANAAAGSAASLARGAPAATSAAASSRPGGYQVVSSALLTAPSGRQVSGSVSCPPTSSGVERRPQSGGVFMTSSSLLANVNSSYPDLDGVSWDAFINNASGADTTFRVWAVCAKPKTGYLTVDSAGSDAPAGSQASIAVLCPGGTKILGGGAFSSSTSVAANVNSSEPVQSGSTYGWLAVVNNGSSNDETFSAWAVCSKYSISKTGYQIVYGVPVDNPAGAQTAAFAGCPSGQSVLGGGVDSSSSDVRVNNNSTYPTSTGWQDYENNASGSGETVSSFAICAS
jgi:hypothetical protein